MGHWEPGRVFQEMNWVDDDKGGCGCGCILTIIVIGAILFALQFILANIGYIILGIFIIAVIYFIVKALME
ncbi:hypothetical protein [Companilactobacillus versmoldensis]|nr:hypothetical protein [Companilactobacillus versmoldensis]